MTSANRGNNETRRSSGFARAWVAIAVLCGLGSFYVALYYWSADIIGHGAAASIPSSLGFVLDELLVVWIILPTALLIALIVAAVIGWRRTIDARSRAQSGTRRRLLLVGTVLASVCATGLALLKLPALLGSASRATICETTTYEESISPNGRYKAAVIQINCGAMSSSNRQIILTRVPFDSAWQSFLYFNNEPTVRLSWRNRELTVVGERPHLRPLANRLTLALIHYSPRTPNTLAYFGIIINAQNMNGR
jgi:hypothetical protein